LSLSLFFLSDCCFKSVGQAVKSNYFIFLVIIRLWRLVKASLERSTSGRLSVFLFQTSSRKTRSRVTFNHGMAVTNFAAKISKTRFLVETLKHVPTHPSSQFCIILIFISFIYKSIYFIYRVIYYCICYVLYWFIIAFAMYCICLLLRVFLTWKVRRTFKEGLSRAPPPAPF
jgi:hypothetical protein